MIITIIVTVKGDLPEDAPYDCQSAVEETLLEYKAEIKDIKLDIQED